MAIRKYLADVMGGMAKGLFASLIIGVIIKQIGSLANIQIIMSVGQFAQCMAGPCVGAGIAYARGCKQFTILASIANGAIGAGTIKILADAAAGAQITTAATGEPLGALIAAIVGVEIGRLLEGRTKFDLLIVPAIAIAGGGAAGIFASPYISVALGGVGAGVSWLTKLPPLPMGILVGIAVGMILTTPISSAALCAGIGIGGIAAGAALAGCCAQMVGFAVMGIRENKLPGLLSQGAGSSMLQLPNIIKNPRVWIPPTIASGVCGALSAALFKIETTKAAAGMGTTGLAGQFETLKTMGGGALVPILILHVAIPAAVSLAIGEFMRHKKWIKPGDLQI